jgi:two-component system, sensor histidine kinase and response regulator
LDILVVDDEKEQLASLRMVLKSSGYKVFEALNAEDALGCLNDDHCRIGLVLTDYIMPGTDGIELLKKIKANNMNMPVVMMTGHGEKDLVISALINHCDGFLEKPFTPDELIHEIERVIVHKPKNTNLFSEFISGVVHQINNPLMAIIGSAELGMLQLDDTNAVKQFLTRIIDATEEIISINKEIFKLRESGEEKTEKVDIRAILDDCLYVFKDLMTLKRVCLGMNLNSDLLYILGNRFSLKQLFKNLILNAIESMDESQRKILKIESEIDKDAKNIFVYIQDTGCGITEESRDKIFTPFFTGKPYGTGIGLAVAKNIIERHNGEIGIRSEVGEGSTFMVRLPLGDAE